MLLTSADKQIDLVLNDIEAIVTALGESESVQNVETQRMKDIFLANVYARSDYIRAIYLGTIDGQMYEWGEGPGFIDNTPTFPEGYDPRKRPWYQTAIKRNGYTITDPYIYASINAMGVTAVKPVYRDGELIGVLGLDLIFDGLQYMVDSLGIEKGGRVMLVSKDNRILVDQFKPNTILTTETQVFDRPELFDGSIIDNIVMMEDEEYLLEHTVNSNTGWTLLMFVPYEDIIAFSQENIKIILFYDILLMMMLGVIVTYLSRKILTNPLETIIHAMREREKGVKDVRIPDQRAYEFMVIARLFNRLSDLSQSLVAEQEEKVRIRTDEVISLQKENTRLRIVKEKEKLYANIHDSLGARLTGIHISNNVAKSALSREEYGVVKEMQVRIDQNTTQGIHDLKEILISNETVPFTSEDLSDYIKVRMVERLALQNISFRYKILTINEFDELNSDLLSGIMRIFQEMVTNTLKYAEALHVELSLSKPGERLLITYRDDGLGFDSKAVKSQSFGIQGILKRVERLGGTVRLVTKPGRGVRYEMVFGVGDKR